ncbi:hypothetical protein EG68_09054 [Paragonimus skrjabini miyazakii]|uniref:DNA polymerase epsilon subunit 3 n=1 Tax=Paragonimus skrjabini miyazakii TaxID=59628 RepID=A0A8S9YE37_9TREM|nr:hypothetical protein EG68_09054 [Paragonimus skrjabini miyazakii]
MAEKVDDLYLPNAVILRIIRDSLPERTVVSREARSAISKAASSFILYVTSLASAHCEAAKRKTLLAGDILAALKEMEFDHYIDQLNEFIGLYREHATQKKNAKRLLAALTEPSGQTSTEPLSSLDRLGEILGTPDDFEIPTELTPATNEQSSKNPS